MRFDFDKNIKWIFFSRLVAIASEVVITLSSNVNTIWVIGIALVAIVSL